MALLAQEVLSHRAVELKIDRVRLEYVVPVLDIAGDVHHISRANHALHAANAEAEASELDARELLVRVLVRLHRHGVLEAEEAGHAFLADDELAGDAVRLNVLR